MGGGKTEREEHSHRNSSIELLTQIIIEDFPQWAAPMAIELKEAIGVLIRTNSYVRQSR